MHRVADLGSVSTFLDRSWNQEQSLKSSWMIGEAKNKQLACLAIPPDALDFTTTRAFNILSVIHYEMLMLDAKICIYALKIWYLVQ